MLSRPARAGLIAFVLLLAMPAAADPGRRAEDRPVPAPDTQAAIVGDALAIAPAPEFLTADHYFVITFDPRTKGVEMDGKLRADFPQRMTIILQHDFLVLFTGGESFTVQLRFDGEAKALTIPYAAVTEFRDPPMGLHFVWPAKGGELAPAP